jgi:hypothetical protein
MTRCTHVGALRRFSVIYLTLELCHGARLSSKVKQDVWAFKKEHTIYHTMPLFGLTISTFLLFSFGIGWR